MKIRIVAGELGGRLVRTPPGRGTRPTAAKVREAWFSALAGRMTGARVLDLFAGSGALGIEALSRGATSAHFVESDPRVARVLEDNLATLDLEEQARLTVADVFRFLDGAAGRDDRWDVALADPPYGTREAMRLLEMFERRPFADLLCLERTADAPPPAREPTWSRRYGDTQLIFMTARPPGGSAP